MFLADVRALSVTSTPTPASASAPTQPRRTRTRRAGSGIATSGLPGSLCGTDGKSCVVVSRDFSLAVLPRKGIFVAPPNVVPAASSHRFLVAAESCAERMPLFKHHPIGFVSRFASSPAPIVPRGLRSLYHGRFHSAGSSGGEAKAVVRATRGKNSVSQPAETDGGGLRRLEDIMADLHKPVPEHVKKRTTPDGFELSYIPWHSANFLLDAHAPGWHGEVRTISYSPNDTVTVIYRITINASNATVWRESSGTAAFRRGNSVDPIQVAEAMAFRRACARFGLGLYLYGGDKGGANGDEEPPF